MRGSLFSDFKFPCPVPAPEAVDAVMKRGMNHPMGPLELAGLHRA